MKDCTIEKKTDHNELSTKLPAIDSQQNSRFYHIRNKLSVFIHPVLEMNTATSGRVKRKTYCVRLVSWAVWTDAFGWLKPQS